MLYDPAGTTTASLDQMTAFRSSARSEPVAGAGFPLEGAIRGFWSLEAARIGRALSAPALDDCGDGVSCRELDWISLHAARDERGETMSSSMAGTKP